MNNMDDDNDGGRNWRITSRNYEDADFQIILKIRGETADNFVPEKLYCSHKYHVIMKIQFPSRLVDSLPKVVVCKMGVVKSDTGEVVLKKGKPILKGILTTGLQRTQTRGKKKNLAVYGGNLRIQFCASSYHFKKSYFVMKLEFFNPDFPDSKLLEISSPKIQTFSRKPTVGKMTLEPETSKAPLIRKKEKKTPPPSMKPPTQSNTIVPPPPPSQHVEDEDEEFEDEDEEFVTDVIDTKRNVTPEVEVKELGDYEIGDDMDDEDIYKKYLEQLEKVKRLKKNLTDEEDQVAEEMTLQKLIEQDDFPREEQTNNPRRNNNDDGFGIEGDMESLLDLNNVRGFDDQILHLNNCENDDNDNSEYIFD